MFYNIIGSLCPQVAAKKKKVQMNDALKIPILSFLAVESYPSFNSTWASVKNASVDWNEELKIDGRGVSIAYVTWLLS